jgi:pyridoxine 5-phosphate synthase
VGLVCIFGRIIKPGYLSVNINKIATLRISWWYVPDLLKVALDLRRFGAQGITIHPRPDRRHIKYQDARGSQR